jgi:hypothetical protein
MIAQAEEHVQETPSGLGVLGHFRPMTHDRAMSALPPIATIEADEIDVR